MAGTVMLGNGTAAAATPGAKAGIKAGAKAPAKSGASATVTPVSSARVPVIVFLKSAGNSGSDLRRDGERFTAERAPFLSAARQAGATGIKTYRLVDAFAATMPQGEVSKLAGSPGVAEVIPDTPITGPDPAPATLSSGVPATTPAHSIPALKTPPRKTAPRKTAPAKTAPAKIPAAKVPGRKPPIVTRARETTDTLSRRPVMKPAATPGRGKPGPTVGRPAVQPPNVTPGDKTPAPATTPDKTPAPKTAPGQTAPKTPGVTPSTAPTAVPGACAKTPQLEPEGLSLTGTASGDPSQETARKLGYTGSGVTVAFLADGIDTGNVNLIRDGRSVVTDYEDFSGEGISAPTSGAAAFQDANAIAGQGQATYNAQGFSALSPNTACELRIEGAAPGANLVALKVFGADNVTTTSDYLQAIDYAVSTDHVNVIDESFGTNPFPDPASLDAVQQFNDAATDEGTTVVVASGDAGPLNTIGAPATDPGVISVGATTDFRFYAQTGYAAADEFATHGWLNNNISSDSSGGFTEPGGTVDMVAPGDLSFASCTADMNVYSGCVNFLGKPSDIEESGGTGESAAEVAGAAALVIQAFQKAHHTAPTPAVVKQILASTATDLGSPATEQGSGMLNSLKAVELASWTPNGDPVGNTLRVSSSQLNGVAVAGTKESWPVTVTNTGTTQQSVSLTGRTSAAAQVIKTGSVTLNDTSSGHFTSWTGAAGNYGTITFTVPANAARLDASITWPATMEADDNPNAPVRLILVSPSGQLAGDSLPQGTGGYGGAEVAHPTAGTWTAVILSDSGTAGGTTGTVQFGASVSGDTSFGTVSPSTLTLAPGASGTFTFATTIPHVAGDSSGSVVLGSAAGNTSIPVTLRGTVPVSGTSGTFSGDLTGGVLAGQAGLEPGGGQTAAYEFTVPSGAKSVDADVTLASAPAVPVTSYLVAPDGQTMGYGDNDLTTGFTGGQVPVESVRRQLSAYAADPVAGTWTLVVGFASPVAGGEPSDSFTGRVQLNSTAAARGGLPLSAATVLTHGKSYTYPIKITNTGAAPEDVFLDARLGAQATYTLEPQDTVSGVALPLAANAEPPEWIVPTLTQSVTAGASSAVPVTFGFGPYSDDPESASGTGPAITASYPPATLPTTVTPGLWDALPSEAGPYPVGGAPSAKATMSMTAETQEFDTAVTSKVGDFWTFAVEPLASSTSYNLFVINPGQTRTIDATIRPDAVPGSVVSGTLYVDDFEDAPSFLAGSQLAALPYTYKTG
ncbi:MAG TPA: hypothetical protein VK817_13690 [Trebonia sp.]|nr:hypothetical protein [Trebonia sp.]